MIYYEQLMISFILIILIAWSHLSQLIITNLMILVWWIGRRSSNIMHRYGSIPGITKWMNIETMLISLLQSTCIVSLLLCHLSASWSWNTWWSWWETTATTELNQDQTKLKHYFFFQSPSAKVYIKSHTHLHSQHRYLCLLELRGATRSRQTAV